MTVTEQIESWVARVRPSLSEGGITDADLDELLQSVSPPRKANRQRLLYLSAESCSIRSALIAMALHEPTPGTITEISGGGSDCPYQSVHDAVAAGWRVVHFPDQRAVADPDEIGILGYEFILEKLEQYDE